MHTFNHINSVFLINISARYPAKLDWLLLALCCIRPRSIVSVAGGNLISAVITCFTSNRITVFVTSFGALEHLKYELTRFGWLL